MGCTSAIGNNAMYVIDYIANLIKTHADAGTLRTSIKQAMLERVSVALQMGVGERIGRVVASHKSKLHGLPGLGAGGAVAGGAAQAGGAAAAGGLLRLTLAGEPPQQ